MAAVAMITPSVVFAFVWGLVAHLYAGAGVFSQQNFWVNLWAGNNTRTRGFMVYPLHPANAAAGVYRHLALGWIFGHPLRFAGLTVGRAVLFWLDPVSYHDLLAAAHHLVSVLWLGWAAVATAAGAAAWAFCLGRLGWAGGLRRLGLPLAAILGQWAMVLPFFVDG